MYVNLKKITWKVGDGTSSTALLCLYNIQLHQKYHVIIYDFISLYTNVSHRPR